MAIPVEYKQINIRKGLAAELPGIPNAGSTVPTQGLNISEPGYTTDTGQLFIGSDPTSGLPQVTRGTFPYANIEVLTENSNGFLQNSFDFHLSDTQTAYNQFDPMTQNSTGNPSDWSYCTMSGQNFQVSVDNNPGNAKIFYFMFDTASGNVNNPIKNGVLDIFFLNNSLTPSLVDDSTAFMRLDISTTDQPSAYGSIQFRAILVNGNIFLQYRNISTYNPVVCFRIERSVFSVS